ncbi:MAG TPA: energy-coupling factor transporter transmembrane protein EcfT [Bacillota bacterium]|jgi:energy-coupling factor transport system permease protein
MNRLAIGQYLPGDSLVHRLDPRTKIAITSVYVIVLFFINNPWGYALAVAFALAGVLLSRVPLRYLIDGIRPILILILLTLVLNVFMTPGQPIWKFGPLTATREGLQSGVTLALRLILLIAVTSLLTLTTSPVALTDGLERLMKPLGRLGLPAHELAMMMTIALRFIPTLLEEAEKIMKAQMARGADFESGNLVKRARALIPLLVPLFISSFRRADELAMAMEARGYHGGAGRTRYRQLRARPADYLAGAVTLLFAGGLIYLRFRG